MTLDNGVAYSHTPHSDDTSVLKFNHAEIDLLRIFQEQILGADAASDDYRSYGFSDLRRFLADLAKNPQRDEAVYRRARYLLLKRIASPFAAVTFAFFGMAFGVSDPRRGKSGAYIGIVLTIIVGYVIMAAFDWLAEHTHIPLLVAAWAPNLILLSFGAFLVYQKNRLPPAEGTLDWANLPFVGRHGVVRRFLRGRR
jgi:lipopolysaccharide export system permease protein